MSLVWPIDTDECCRRVTERAVATVADSYSVWTPSDRAPVLRRRRPPASRHGASRAVTRTPTVTMTWTALDDDDVVRPLTRRICSSAVLTAAAGPASDLPTSSTVSLRKLLSYSSSKPPLVRCWRHSFSSCCSHIRIIYEQFINMISYKQLVGISPSFQLRFSSSQRWTLLILRSKCQRQGYSETAYCQISTNSWVHRSRSATTFSEKARDIPVGG